MRVIQTVESIAERSGGPSRTVTRLCSAMARCLGGTVDLVAGIDRPTDDRLIRPDVNSVKLQLIDAHQWKRLRYYPAFSRTLIKMLDEQGPPALIHDNGIWGHTNLAAWWAACRRAVPYVLTPRGMLEPWALDFKACKKRLALMLYQRRIVESAAVVVATSRQECDNVKRLFPRLPVAVIPNGVDVPAMVDMLPGRTPADGGGTVLFMSRIHPKKNLIGLLKAWRLLSPEAAAGWRLVIAGPHESRHAQEVVSLVRELGLENSVELIGAVGQESKAAVFQSADVFVLPSFSENFGIVVTEALAHGVPVITTRGTPWEELPRYGCGWWTDPTADALTETLRQAMCMDPTARRVMGEKGRTYARRFDWNTIAQRTIEVYRWVLGKGTKPDSVTTD